MANRGILNDQDVPYTVSEAAAELGVHVSLVYRWLREGLLRRAPVRGAITLIEAESVERLKRERELNPPRRGRPPKRAVRP